jgi:hypothetical protein
MVVAGKGVFPPFHWVKKKGKKKKESKKGKI